MNVFVKNQTDSIAIDRIENAIKKYSPKNVKFCSEVKDADLVILFINGRYDHFKRLTEELINNGKKYVLVQLCLKSTKKPKAKDWIKIWEKAELVWSYYDLYRICDEEGIDKNFNFYHAPLGIDEVFLRQKTSKQKNYIITSSGVGYLAESVRECIIAAKNVNSKVFHVGPIVTDRKNVDFSNGMSDTDLASKLSECKYVSGLRRLEGFEIPIIESFACGARPIVFDRVDNRNWFNDFAIFIDETNREQIIKDLTIIFKSKYNPPTKKEIENVKKMFNWKKIITNFWKKMK